MGERYSWTVTYLDWKVSSLTIQSFFSGTCFHMTGSARSTRALALRRPKPNRLLTINPAPFLFQPGLLDRGSYSEVQTTMCCRSLQVRSGLRVGRRIKWAGQTLHINTCKLEVTSNVILCTFVPGPGQIFQQPGGQMLMFLCESECTRCANRH